MENQNLIKGLIFGVAAAIASAILWAFITVITKYQMGFMAVGLGFIVGYAVRIGGKGIDQVFGIMGALLALLGCLLGNYFIIIAIFSNQVLATGECIGYLGAISSLGISGAVAFIKEGFSLLDLVFYAIAIYEGYKFSFLPNSEEGSKLNS